MTIVSSRGEKEWNYIRTNKWHKTVSWNHKKKKKNATSGNICYDKKFEQPLRKITQKIEKLFNKGMKKIQ